MLAAAGCGGADLPADQRWSSEHFVFHTRSGEHAACADVLTLLERHFTTMQAYVGFAWPQERVVDYYKFVDRSDLDAHGGCGGGARCTSGSTIQSDSAFDPHELIHAYLAPTGEPPPVIVEGAAVALACQTAGQPRPTSAAGDLLALADGNPDLYPAGGWLVSYLLDQFGPDSLLALYSGLGRTVSAGDADAMFMSIYGMKFADLWAAATAADVPRNVCPWECSQPAIGIGDGPADTNTGVCGQANEQATFSAAAGDSLLVSSDGPGFRVGSCGHTADLPPAIVVGGAGAAGLYKLAAGDYFLDHANQPGTINAARADATTLDSSCHDGGAGAALAAFDSLSVFVPRSAQTWFLSNPWSQDRSFSLSTTNAQANAFLCPSCAADPTACPAAMLGASQSLAAVDAVRFEVDPGAPMSGFLLVLH